MAFVNGVVTTVPEHRVDQEAIRTVGRKLMKGRVPFLEQALALFNNAGVDQRFLVRPIEELMTQQDLGWRNKVFIEASKEMGLRLMHALLEQTNTDPQEVDLIITTSCTGFMIPSLDAYLINALRMRHDAKRLPITELGCAAGAMALSRANEYLRAFPQHKVVVMAVELPSLTVQFDDFRLANVVSSALFGDGGAAVLLSGETGPCQLLENRTHFFYDTPEMMGFDLDHRGFKIILDKKISALVRDGFNEPVNSFLADQGYSVKDLAHMVFHPGGRRIMDSLREVLNLQESDLSVSRAVLREVGNLSSASVLWVLGETLKQSPKGLGLMAAFGPGFNAEMLSCRFESA